VADEQSLTRIMQKSFPGLLLILPLRVDWTDLSRIDPHPDLATAVVAPMQTEEIFRRAA
jgi:hypothetical protein